MFSSRIERQAGRAAPKSRRPRRQGRYARPSRRRAAGLTALRGELLEERRLLDASVEWSTYTLGDDFIAGAGPPTCVDVSDAGNIFIPSVFAVVPSDADVGVAKISPAGQTGWQAVFDEQSLPKALKVDANENVFVSGHAFGYESYVMQLDATGAIKWSWSLDERNYRVEPEDLAVDASGTSVYVVGYKDYVKGNDSAPGFLFVTKLSVDQAGKPQFQWSYTYGSAGSGRPADVAIDSGGNLVVVGEAYSADLGATTFDTELGGAKDAFVMKLSPQGTVLWSSLLGGSGDELGLPTWGQSWLGVAVDAHDDIFVGGTTTSEDLLTSAPWQALGFNTSLSGPSDAFVAKLSKEGEGLWATYLGGLQTDFATDVAVDASGNVLITGLTTSANDGWVAGGFDVELNGAKDGFVAQLTPDGQHVWSSYLGGDGDDQPHGIAWDAAGYAIVAGTTTSPGWIAGGYDTNYNGGTDGFVVKIRSGQPPAPTPAIRVTPTVGLETSEAGATAAFAVVLATEPTAPVSIEVTSSDTSEGTIVGAAADGVLTLIFDATNWNAPQTVTVQGQEDAEPDGDQTFSVVLAPATSSDGNYDGLDAADLSVLNIDNEVAPSPQLYVWDIRFETQGLNTQIVVDVRLDLDGIASPDDAAAEGVDIWVQLSNGKVLKGTTDSSGVFRSQSFKRLAPGTRAEVIDLAYADYKWDPDAVLDPTFNDEDADHDGLPDEEY